MKYTCLDTVRTLAPLKKPGYLEAIARAGRLVRGGQWYELSEEDHARIAAQYATEAAPPAVRPPRGIGLGDALATIATPIARALKLDCIDPATGNLRRESGCFRRQQRLNRLTL